MSDLGTGGLQPVGGTYRRADPRRVDLVAGIDGSIGALGDRWINLDLAADVSARPQHYPVLLAAVVPRGLPVVDEGGGGTSG